MYAHIGRASAANRLGAANFASIADTNAPDGQRGKVVSPYPVTMPSLYRKLHIGNHYAQLGKDTEFVYSGSFWEPAIAYPGNQEFVAAYQKGFNLAPANQSAGHYAGCQLSVDAIGRTGGLDPETLREALLTLKTKTVHSDFAVDERGCQIAHKFETSHGRTAKRSWFAPDVVATGKARLPTGPSLRTMNPSGIPHPQNLNHVLGCGTMRM